MTVGYLAMNLEDPDNYEAPVDQWMVNLNSYRDGHYRLGGLRLIEAPIFKTDRVLEQEMSE